MRKLIKEVLEEKIEEKLKKYVLQSMDCPRFDIKMKNVYGPFTITCSEIKMKIPDGLSNWFWYTRKGNLTLYIQGVSGKITTNFHDGPSVVDIMDHENENLPTILRTYFRTKLGKLKPHFNIGLIEIFYYTSPTSNSIEIVI